MSALADVEGEGQPLAPVIQQGMPGFRAEMRHVHDRRRIIRNHAQHLTRHQRGKTFARLENGQGAQQAKRIKGDIRFIHTDGIAAIFQPVNAELSD